MYARKGSEEFIVENTGMQSVLAVFRACTWPLVSGDAVTICYWNSLYTTNHSISFIKSLIGMQHVESHLFYASNKEANILHAELRMNCRRLNYHLFLLHVIDYLSLCL